VTAAPPTAFDDRCRDELAETLLGLALYRRISEFRAAEELGAEARDHLEHARDWMLVSEYCDGWLARGEREEA